VSPSACPPISQELNYRASVRVADLLCGGVNDREALLAEALPLVEAHRADSRRRAAASVLTRLGLGRFRHPRATGLHRLLLGLREPAGCQLLTYVVALREPLLAAVATEVLYPYFVNRETPARLSREEFSAANANGLFEVAGAITPAAVAEYVRRRRRVADPSASRRVLRILRKGGLLGAAWMTRSVGRCLGYFPTIGLPDLACFAYALHAVHGDGDHVRLDRVRAGLFVRLFMLRPIAVDFLLERAAETGLIDNARSGIARLTPPSLDEAVAAMLEAHHDGR
jgi:hypothetical protein